MVLVRISMVAVLAAAGCTQSLFDSNVGDDDGVIDARIGGPDADVNAPDADVNAPDADVNAPDANVNMPDGGSGGTPCNLTAGCLGDLVEEWDDVQGGTLGRFRYLDDTRALFDAYTAMAYGTWASVMAWVGAGTAPAPAIVNCDLFADEGVCAGLDGRLLLSPSDSGAGRRDAVVEWTAPLSGTIHLAGDYRSADGATGMPQKILISRNTRHDLLYKDTFLPSALPEILDLDVDVLAGDRILLAAAPPTSGTSVPLGFKLRYLDADAFPGACQFALSMGAGAPGLTDNCNGAVMTDETDWGGGLTAAAPSFSTAFGDARVFTEGDYLTSSGAAFNMSGDFTIQFWMRNDQTPGGDWTTEVITSNWECADKRGMLVSFDSESSLFYVRFFWDPAKDYCNVDPSEGFTATVTFDANWHFYRIVRSSADGTIKLCIDGQTRGQATVPAAADITNSIAPHIGRNVTFNPPYFSGALDDFRVYSRALPCPSP